VICFDSKVSIAAGNDASFSTSWSRNSNQFAVASQGNFDQVYIGLARCFRFADRVPKKTQDNLVSVWDVRKTSQKLAALGTSQRGSFGAARVVKFAQEGTSELMAFAEQRGMFASRKHLGVRMLTRNV
jgi:hypothetical protein